MEQLDTTLPEDGADVTRNAWQALMQHVMYSTVGARTVGSHVHL